MLQSLWLKTAQTFYFAISMCQKSGYGLTELFDQDITTQKLRYQQRLSPDVRGSLPISLVIGRIYFHIYLVGSRFLACFTWGPLLVAGTPHQVLAHSHLLSQTDSPLSLGSQWENLPNTKGPI